MNLEIPSISESDSADAVPVSEKVFGQPLNEALIHQLVTAYLAGARQGTKAQKSRADVRGGGRKPWRQKGNGRARAGSSSSPIWRSGGVTFAARPRNYAQKVNRKMYQAGMRSILSELLRQGRLVVSEDIVPDHPKTKLLATKLKEYNVSKALIVTDTEDRNLDLSSRNLPGTDVGTAININPVGLVSANTVILTRRAVGVLEERLG
ncbi:MAG: 50S ribosomal protein L4 [Methylococcaceae bacterium]|nr:50S ribosomal protein L4 [Methylococcaceae bacterium]MCI0668141.1 50S ribosomal protein L4 [Methylococcaceae bacterium]MCI0733150.1 50S ribosomal protein L4 [Methylococcaceae bacterium]